MSLCFVVFLVLIKKWVLLVVIVVELILLVGCGGVVDDGLCGVFVLMGVFWMLMLGLGECW